MRALRLVLKGGSVFFSVICRLVGWSKTSETISLLTHSSSPSHAFKESIASNSENFHNVPSARATVAAFST